MRSNLINYIYFSFKKLFLNKNILWAILFYWALSLALVCMLYALVRPWLPDVVLFIGNNQLIIDKKLNRLWSPDLFINFKDVNFISWVINSKLDYSGDNNLKVFFDDGELVTVVPALSSIYPSDLRDWSGKSARVGLETEKMSQVNGLIVFSNPPSLYHIIKDWFEYEPLSFHGNNFVVGKSTQNNYMSIQYFLFFSNIITVFLFFYFSPSLKNKLKVFIVIMSIHWVIFDYVWQINLFKIIYFGTSFSQDHKMDPIAGSNYLKIRDSSEKLSTIIPNGNPVYMYGNNEWIGILFHYLLVPKNISSMQTSLPAQALPKGWFLLVIIDEQRKVIFNKETKKIYWNNIEQKADIMFSDNLVELYIIQ